MHKSFRLNKKPKNCHVVLGDSYCPYGQTQLIYISKGDHSSEPSLENYKICPFIFFSHMISLIAQKNSTVSLMLVFLKDCPCHKITFRLFLFVSVQK